MELKIVRKWFTEQSTIGEFYINGEFHCYTLEDKYRGTDPKVPGATAIPEGRYPVIIDMSTRFKKLMPHILNVKDFTGVRIHKGNDAQDTEGCPLVGMQKSEDKIWDCAAAYDPFFAQLQEALKTEKVWITVTSDRQEMAA